MRTRSGIAAVDRRSGLEVAVGLPRGRDERHQQAGVRRPGGAVGGAGRIQDVVPGAGDGVADQVAVGDAVARAGPGEVLVVRDRVAGQGGGLVGVEAGEGAGLEGAGAGGVDVQHDALEAEDLLHGLGDALLEFRQDAQRTHLDGAEQQAFEQAVATERLLRVPPPAQLADQRREHEGAEQPQSGQVQQRRPRRCGPGAAGSRRRPGVRRRRRPRGGRSAPARGPARRPRRENCANAHTARATTARSTSDSPATTTDRHGAGVSSPSICSSADAAIGQARRSAAAATAASPPLATPRWAA